MNAELSQNETFETCDKNQTTIEPNTNTLEPCDNNQTKIGRGGYRKNSGAKSSGIETVTVRIDERLLNTVTRIKAEFKDGKLSLDDLTIKPAPKQDDAKLLRKIAKLERDKEEIRDGFFKILGARDQLHDDEISALKSENDLLKSQLLEVKQIKRLIQFLHPDKQVNEKNRAIATELTAILNGLRGGQ